MPKTNLVYTAAVKFKDSSGNDWIAYPGDSVYNRVKELSDANKEIIIPLTDLLAGWGMQQDKEDVKIEKWNHLAAIKRIREKIETGGFPLAKKPKIDVEKLDFPDDLTKLSSQQLGALLSGFEAWRVYVQRHIVFLDIERKILTDTYDIGVGKCLFNMEKASEKKKLKESMIGFIVSTVTSLRRTKERIIELDAEYAAFNRLQEIYNGSIFAISREISRRQSELTGFNRETNLK